MRSQGQTYDIARRLSRGEILYEGQAISMEAGMDKGCSCGGELLGYLLAA